MRTVWKFPLSVRGWTETAMGAASYGATPVVLAALDPATGAPAVWLEGDDDGEPLRRVFGVFGTGHEIGEDCQHVGSMIDRDFVWHIYERIEDRG